MRAFSIFAFAIGAAAGFPSPARELSPRPTTNPIPITTAQFLNGEHENELVRLEGTVIDVFRDDVDFAFRFLVISSGNDTIYAPSQHITEPDEVLEALIGARVSICGLNDHILNSTFTRNQLRRNLYVFSIDDIKVLEPAPKCIYDVPELGDLSDVRPGDLPKIGRHRIIGKVLAIWGRQMVLVETQKHLPMRIELREHNNLPTVGDFIEAVGLPETDIFHLNLTRALWRSTKAFSCPPQTVTAICAHDILTDRFGKPGFNTEFHGRVVRLKGTIVNIPRGEGERFFVENESHLIPIDATSATNALKDLEIGCIVSVTGVCIMNTENWTPGHPFPRIRDVMLAIHDNNDITVLSRPPWWTPGRVWGVVCILFAALLGFVIWNRSLTILANRRGRELMREQIGRVRADLKTEERTRLAVELHDTLAQNLTGVSMEIEAANGLKGTPDMEPHLDFAAKALKSCRDELRNCLWDLRSQALEEKDMNTAILRTLQPHVSDSCVAVRFNVPRAKVSDNTAHALLRVIRELVVNAIRHGNASTIKVAGSLDSEALRCSVTDNGSGFDPETAPGVLQGHFGIQGMRERIEELGGEFTLESTPGKGTRAAIVIPVPKEG